MTDFNGNTSSKENLRQRVNSALQQLKALKKKDAWSALLKPEPLRRPRARRAGVTMFDVALWTLVLIPVLVGVLSLYNGVVDSTRTAALRSQLTRAVAIIERDHTYSGVYTAASLVDFLKNEGFTTKELHEKSAGVYEFFSPYGTEITIKPESAKPRHFVVVVTNLPPSGCEAAAMTFANKNSGLNKLVIGTADDDLTAADGGVTEDAVRTACDVPANNEKTDVTLTF